MRLTIAGSISAGSSGSEEIQNKDVPKLGVNSVSVSPVLFAEFLSSTLGNPFFSQELTGHCPYEHTCCFAHGPDELRDITSNHKVLIFSFFTPLIFPYVTVCFYFPCLLFVYAAASCWLLSVISPT